MPPILLTEVSFVYSNYTNIPKPLRESGKVGFLDYFILTWLMNNRMQDTMREGQVLGSYNRAKPGLPFHQDLEKIKK